LRDFHRSPAFEFPAGGGHIDGASHIRHHRADLAINRRSAAFSRGLPLEKAFKPEYLLAFVMNGEPLTRIGARPDDCRSG
jgi:DMSO/TMAO reductase YedYZ molybdopterin-dependent catalytic subunit